MANGESIKDGSPFPSGPEMDLDMMRATPITRNGDRAVEMNDTQIARIQGEPGHRDLWTRRIEMMGDLYEGLRRAAEKMSAAGIDTAEENAIMAEFITPKPFPEA